MLQTQAPFYQIVSTEIKVQWYRNFNAELKMLPYYITDCTPNSMVPYIPLKIQNSPLLRARTNTRYRSIRNGDF